MGFNSGFKGLILMRGDGGWEKVGGRWGGSAPFHDISMYASICGNITGTLNEVILNVKIRHVKGRK